MTFSSVTLGAGPDREPAPFAAPARRGSATGTRSASRFVDWIWHFRGVLPLAPGQSNDEAFGRLEPLFRQTGTGHERTGDTLAFRKKDQDAQDKMAVFDSGFLWIEQGTAGPVLRYDLVSRALLFCFLAPLLFLGFAQLTAVIAKFEHPAPAADKVAKAKAAKHDTVVPLNPIDTFLGAPEPEKPKAGKEADEAEGHKKPSSKPAYVFAIIFAVLYVVGRVLEDRLVRRLFGRSLSSA